MNGGPLEKGYLQIDTASDQETIALGRKLGENLVAGDVVALTGALGSGKTWFTKGIGLGLGIGPKVIITSPSFTLVNEYQGRCPLYHIDLYRLESLSEVLSAGLEEFLHEDGVAVLEWADRWPEMLPERSVKVELMIIDEHSRRITLSGRHSRACDIIEALGQGIENGVS